MGEISSRSIADTTGMDDVTTAARLKKCCSKMSNSALADAWLLLHTPRYGRHALEERTFAEVDAIGAEFDTRKLRSVTSSNGTVLTPVVNAYGEASVLVIPPDS